MDPKNMDLSQIDWTAMMEAAVTGGFLDKVVDGRFAKCREVEIELVFPISIDGVETSKVTISRPTNAVRDYVSKMNLPTSREREETLMAKLCGIKIDDFKQIDEDDYREIVAVYDNFFSQHPRTKAPGQ